MQKKSWDLLAPSFKDYAYAVVVGRFIKRASQELYPLALMLFGSLARGNYHQRSDADFCLVLAQPPASLFEGYDRVVTCDPAGDVSFPQTFTTVSHLL